MQKGRSKNDPAYITGLFQVPNEIIMQRYFINYKMLYRYRVVLL